MGNWLQDFLHATRRAESPRSFLYWSGIATISAILNNRVWIDKAGYYKLFPNIYVLIVAKSGLRKNFPIECANRMVGDIGNTRNIAGRSSIQAILSILSKAMSVPEKGMVIKDAIAFINSGEFASSLVRDPDALTLLTDIYDYKKKWTNSLKTVNPETLYNTCITLIGGLNPTHFNDIITAKEIGGGFIGRCILVMETKRSHVDALLRKKEEFPPVDFDELEKYLRQVADLNGEMIITEEAMAYFENWYENEFSPEEVDDETGTANRIHDTILKVAMCLSAAKRLDLTIQLEDIREAMELCLKSTTNVNRITRGVGIHVDSQKLVKFITRILNCPGYAITRGEILKKEWGNIDKYDLDRIVDTLVDQDGVTIEGVGAATVYTLTQKALEGLEGTKWMPKKKQVV